MLQHLLVTSLASPISPSQTFGDILRIGDVFWNVLHLIRCKLYPLIANNECLTGLECKISLGKERCSRVVYILFIQPRLKPSCKIDGKVTNLLSNVSTQYDIMTRVQRALTAFHKRKRVH